MTSNNYCEKCEKGFSSEEALAMHTKSKHPETTRDPLLSKKAKKRLLIYSIIILVPLLIVAVFLLIPAPKTLPPTTMQGHIEVAPESHILKEPMRIEVQKHMLEHNNGEEGERGAVVINYDCQNYDCESDLIEKLENFAIEYDYVYVAPWKNMEKKIALTKLGRIQTLDSYNENVIRSFIE